MLVGCGGDLGNIPLIIRHEYNRRSPSQDDEKERSLTVLLVSITLQQQ